MVTSARGNLNPQIAKAIVPQKVLSHLTKERKMLLKQVLAQPISASPSANLRNKLQDKAKQMAALVQEITEELQAIEEESLNDEHNSKVTQESDLEQEDSNNHLTDDDQ